MTRQSAPHTAAVMHSHLYLSRSDFMISLVSRRIPELPGQAEPAVRIFTGDEYACYSTGKDRARAQLLDARH